MSDSFHLYFRDATILFMRHSAKHLHREKICNTTPKGNLDSFVSICRCNNSIMATVGGTSQRYRAESLNGRNMLTKVWTEQSRVNKSMKEVFKSVSIIINKCTLLPLVVRVEAQVTFHTFKVLVVSCRSQKTSCRSQASPCRSLPINTDKSTDWLSSIFTSYNLQVKLYLHSSTFPIAKADNYM